MLEGSWHNLERFWERKFLQVLERAILAPLWNIIVENINRNWPYAERKETGSDQLENEASWALFTRVRNMAAHGSVSSRLSQSLTEEDIPGASLQGRNPTALKTDELRFWLKCRGDPAKGLKTKAQLSKR